MSDQGDYTCQIGDGLDGDLIHSVEILSKFEWFTRLICEIPNAALAPNQIKAQPPERGNCLMAERIWLLTITCLDEELCRSEIQSMRQLLE